MRAWQAGGRRAEREKERERAIYAFVEEDWKKERRVKKDTRSYVKI